LANLLGRRICVPMYRLAPEHPYPAACEDAMAVYSALKTRCCIVGESAGGNLALALMLEIASMESKLNPPIAMALLSPWADLTHSGDSHLTLANLDPTLSIKHFLEPASLAYAGSHCVSSPTISPLFASFPSQFPPTIISTATRDLLLSDSVRLAKKLRRGGNTVELQVAEGLWHVFEWDPELPESLESLCEIATFLCKYLQPKA